MADNSPDHEAFESIDIREHIRMLGLPKVLELPQLKTFHQWLDWQRLSRQSGRVVGDSRTGKTWNCRAYHSQVQVTQEVGRPPHVPVVYWKVPEKLSASRFYVGLLASLQYSDKRGRLSDLQGRAYEVLENCRVEMIIFDEAQRIPETTMSCVRDIDEDLGISTIVVGTDRLNTVLKRDEQVKNRYVSSYRFNPFDAEELREVTGLWEKYMLPFPDPSHLTDYKAQSLLSQATRGYIGHLALILKMAAIQSLQAGKTSISVPTLRKVISECSF